MKLRPRYYERDRHCEAQEFGISACNQLDVMQPGSNMRHGDGGTTIPVAQAAKDTGEVSGLHEGDICIQMGSTGAETGENSGSTQHPRLGPRSRSRTQSPSEARGAPEAGPDTEDQSSSNFSELRYLFHWLHKCLPYFFILSLKLLTQHLTGISVGIGLLTTFMYANKTIVNQVFLRERCSKLHCVWLLVFLTGSSLLLYYTFYSQSLHYSLILLSPAVDYMNIWEVLWIVEITDFMLKFLFMGFKCIILLLPSFVMSFKAKGYWYMLLEELCQFYRTIVPVPVWFQYFVGSRELNGTLGWSFGVLLALLYLILKLLTFFGQLKNLQRVLRIFYRRPSYGVAASKRQCADAEDLCSICQAEFQKPLLLVCQHIFCEECITLWFNREKTCPLCRTTIADHIHKWKDGDTSEHLQIF